PPPSTREQKARSYARPARSAGDACGSRAGSSRRGIPRAPAGGFRPGSPAGSPSRARDRSCETRCAPCGSPCAVSSFSIRDRQLPDALLVPEAAPRHRVVQLDLEALASADLSAHRERSAEHRRSRRELLACEAPEQVARGEHLGDLALLVEPAPAALRDV